MTLCINFEKTVYPRVYHNSCKGNTKKCAFGLSNLLNKNKNKLKLKLNHLKKLVKKIFIFLFSNALTMVNID